MTKGITHKELVKLHGRLVVVKHGGRAQAGRISVNKGSGELIYFCSNDEKMKSRVEKLLVKETFGYSFARCLSRDSTDGRFERNSGITEFVCVIEEGKFMTQREKLIEVISSAEKELKKAREELSKYSEGIEVDIPIFDGGTKQSIIFNDGKQRLGEKNGQFIVSTFNTKGRYADSRQDFVWIKCEGHELEVGDIFFMKGTGAILLENSYAAWEIEGGSVVKRRLVFNSRYKVSKLVRKEDTFKDPNLKKPFVIRRAHTELGYKANDEKFIGPHIGKTCMFVEPWKRGCLYVTNLRVSYDDKAHGDYITKDGFLILGEDNVEELTM